jgi:uncharacterized protein YbjT (DUF2867 family)
MTTFLVSGATGNVGSAVFRRLLSAGRAVRGGSRTPGSSGLPSENAVRLDLNSPETFPLALDGVDKVFLYAQATDIDPFLKAATARGKPHLVFLSSISVVLPGADNDPVALRHLVQERNIVDSGLPYTFLRPSDFAVNAVSPLDWAETIRSSRSAAVPYPDSRVSPIHEHDIAEVAYHVLTSDDHVNDGLSLTGPAIVTPRQQIENTGVALGETVICDEITPDEWRERMRSRLPAHVIGDYLDWWARLTDVPAFITDTVERVTGRLARTHVQWTKDHLTDFL